MIEDNKLIYPMMIELSRNIEENVYYVGLPKVIKEKWIELERASTSKPIYNLPTITLKRLLCSYSEGIVNINSVTEYSDDSKWIVCFKDINMKIVCTCFKIWIDEFYIKGSLDKSKRKNGRDAKVHKLANELINLIMLESFEGVNCEKITLFENGSAACKEAFLLFPQKLIDLLIGETIDFKGKKAKLLYSSQNELVTDTNIFGSEKGYHSFAIRLSVQTLPPDNKAYLNVDLIARRWITKNDNLEGTNYIGNNKNCYIRVASDKLHSIKTQYSYEEKCNIWDDIDIRCFKECEIDSNIVSFKDVIKQPELYNKGKIGDILIPYQEGITDIEPGVKNGTSFSDRKVAFDFISEYILNTFGISSKIEAIALGKPVTKTNNTFYINKTAEIDSEYVINQLEKAVSGEVVNVEVYAKGKSEKILEKYLNSYFGNSEKVNIKSCEYNEDIFKALEKDENSNRDNISGFESRIDKIINSVPIVKTPTIAFILIHDAKYFSKLKAKDKINLDPKEAIRAGFAQTGRLTQFITFEECEKQEANIIKANTKYEVQKQKALEKGKEPKKQSKLDNVNKAINGAILDGLRQLGVVYDYHKNKKMTGKKIVGIHICNYKRTLYGSIKPFPIIITYDVDNSRIMAYCELVDKVEIPYWKAILGLSKLAIEKDIYNVSKTISATTMYRRMERIVLNSDSDTIIIVDANGTSRNFIKGISNSEIKASEREHFNKVRKLLINDDKYIDLSQSKNDISIIRLRHNDEVPSYLVKEKDESRYLNTSGLFKYKEIYYSLDQRPKAEDKAYVISESKAIKDVRYSHRNIMEMYPIYISGDSSNIEENEINAIGIVHLLRGTSIQYASQLTILPMPLHMAMKMEEYI